MKILLINYRYFISSGPEKYMFSIKDLLEKKGHDVIIFSLKSKKNLPSKYEKYFAEPIGSIEQVYYEEYKKTPKTIFQMIERQFYSIHVRKKLEALIKDTKPDIAYLLHHYNKVSPSVIDACKKFNIPVIMRVSDFFLICANGLLYRNGKLCEDCLREPLLYSVKKKCVKNSYIATLVKVMAMYYHKITRIYEKVDFIVVPSKFTMEKLKAYKNLVHIPTFTEIDENSKPKIGQYLLYVGRVEREKGILEVIKAIQNTSILFKIAGKSSTGFDNEIKRYIEEKNIKNVELLGNIEHKNLKELYRNARAIIIPSTWYENMPNVALEAMANSKPVLASNLGSLKELVKENFNGLLFEPGNINEIKQKVEIIFKDEKLCKKLGENSFNEAKTKYNSEKHYQKLIKLFIIAKKKKKAF